MGTIILVAVIAVVVSPVVIIAAYAACVFLGALFFRTERYVDNWISAILCEIDYLAPLLSKINLTEGILPQAPR